jgi:hypothetical protein
MFKYEKMDGEKPISYKVEFEGRKGVVFKTGNTDRAKRWHLDGVSYNESQDFRSRREAFHFFMTGEKFDTKPVFETLGGRKGSKRIR